MVDFALNHMTVANASYATLIDLAARLGCIGVEVRNDLGKPLFDGRTPEVAGAMAREKDLRILCVAEVKRFNAWDDSREGEARDLVRTAAAAGAEAVCRIPRNDGIGTGDGERQANLRVAPRGLRPMLEDTGMTGLVEPLGFAVCALRYKSEVVEAIDESMRRTPSGSCMTPFTTISRGAGRSSRSIRESSMYPASWIRASRIWSWRTATARWTTNGTGSANTEQIAALVAGGIWRADIVRGLRPRGPRHRRSGRRARHIDGIDSRALWRPPRPDARFVTP